MLKNPWRIKRGFHGFNGTPLLKGCLRVYLVSLRKHSYVHYGPRQGFNLYLHAMWACGYYQFHFPAPHGCYAASAERSGATPLNSGALNVSSTMTTFWQWVVQLLLFHPIMTPEMISEGLKSSRLHTHKPFCLQFHPDVTLMRYNNRHSPASCFFCHLS